jgi:hypothetical protein
MSPGVQIGLNIVRTVEVFKWGQLSSCLPDYADGMMSCSYCAQPATMRILAEPEQVCFDHALEFWTGLLVYARSPTEPCVKNEELCSCPACEAASALYLRTMAIAAAGPSPGDHERVTMVAIRPSPVADQEHFAMSLAS